MQISDKELLVQLAKTYNIELNSVEDEIKNSIREEFVKGEHPYSIFEGKDGRWWTQVPDETKKKKRRMVARKKRSSLIEYLYDFYNGDISNKNLDKVTLEDLYPEWLEYKKLHTDAKTYITRLDTDWKTYYKGTPIVQVPLRKLTPLMLDEWAHDMIQSNNMTKTCYYNMRTIMNQSLEYAVERGILDTNPLSAVKVNSKLFRKMKKKESHTQVYTDKERDDIILLCYRDYYSRCKVYQLSPLALIFQFLTGVRIGELCALKHSDIERENYIHVQRMLRRDLKEVVPYAKTEAGDREVYLVKEARRILSLCRERQKELNVSTEYIFSVTPGPMTEECINELLKKYSKELKIPYRSSHKVRKTAGSLIVDKLNINAAREMLGHEDERVTLKHYCFDRTPDAQREQQLEEAFKRIS